jgi:hypothetical protein
MEERDGPGALKKKIMRESLGTIEKVAHVSEGYREDG